MPAITIIGLGPGDPEQLTLEAWRALQSADEVWLRTNRPPAANALPAGANIAGSFDHLYETLPTLAEVCEGIAQKVIALGQRPQGVCYATPGHPLVGESATRRILELARERGLETRLIAGVSELEPALIALQLDPFEGLQLCDATLLARRHHPSLDPDVGALIVQLYNRHLAAQVKTTLLNLYHEDHPARLVHIAGAGGATVRELPLYAIDRQDDLDHLTALYLPPLAQPGSLASYQDLVARLRAPDGCPWDRKQTHQTLRTHLLEETYEVLEALDADDMPALREELGDLLLQVFLHAQIATEEGDFRLIDTVQQVIAKLIRRHPHVFGDVQVDGAEGVLRNWEQIKREEKSGKGEFRSMLSGASAALPALSRALEMQRRAARVGFDWPSIQPVADKVREEIGEFAQAASDPDRAAEFGDLLFSLVNLARWNDIDAESALREANARFARRFEYIERQALAAGRSLDQMTLAEMDALWEQAKLLERG